MYFVIPEESLGLNSGLYVQLSKGLEQNCKTMVCSLEQSLENPMDSKMEPFKVIKDSPCLNKSRVCT